MALLRTSQQGDKPISNDILLTSTQIGQGSFAQVFLGTRLSSQQPLAIKVVQKARLNKKIMEALESEIRILKAMEHEHIVRLEDIIVFIISLLISKLSNGTLNQKFLSL